MLTKKVANEKAGEKRCLKPYMVENKYTSEGHVVLAETSKEARSWGFHEVMNDTDCEFIDVRSRLIKEKVDIEGLEKGIVTPSLDSVKRRIHSWVEYFTCPNCGKKNQRIYEIDEGVLGCSGCEKSG